MRLDFSVKWKGGVPRGLISLPGTQEAKRDHGFK